MTARVSNKRKVVLLLDQIDQLVRSGSLHPGERRRWQAWRRRIATILDTGSASTSDPGKSIAWEKLASEAIILAEALSNRVDEMSGQKAARRSRDAAGQAPGEGTEQASSDGALGRDQAMLPIAVTIPATTITVSATLHLEILRAMSREGLARSWRIAERVLAAGLAVNENSVRNALRRLTAMGLIGDYMERGKPLGWSPTRGGSRRLVVLTEIGCRWCQTAFGRAPVASELFEAVARHQSFQHGIAVLEARDYLRLAGYRVDDKPRAVLATVTEQWGKRTEPDLLLEMEGSCWPVEVQREVSKRVTAKWEKCIALAGRLALILLNNEHLAMQRTILHRELLNRRSHLAGIRLASLEDLQHGDWQWCEPHR